MTGGAAFNAGPTGLEPIGNRALVVGVVAAAACAAGAFMNPAQFFRSWLVAFLFWLGISIGCLAIVMLHHLSGGAWGMVIRRVLESGTRTLPLMAAAFVPLLFGMKSLYAWARPEVVAADPLLQHKSPYLNAPFFIARAAIYFGAWIGMAWLLNAWSRRQDGTRGDAGLVRRFQLLSAPGIVAVVLTVTFASVDWVMSLEPHWFSTIYGILLLVGMALGAFAFVIVVTLRLWREGPLSETISAVHLHDLGKLLFTFVMVWAYFAFSQFLIIWAGNLPEEIPWYLRRLSGGWQVVAAFILLFHFVLPFLLLLPRATKRNAMTLLGVAVLLVVMRLVDLYWMTAPAPVAGAAGSFHWLDLAAPVALGGIWIWFFVRQLARMPLLPVGDPYLAEALEHGHA